MQIHIICYVASFSILNVLAVAMLKGCRKRFPMPQTNSDEKCGPSTYFHGIPFLTSPFRVEKYFWFFLLLISFGFAIRQIYSSIDAYVSEKTSTSIGYGTPLEIDRPVLCFELKNEVFSDIINGRRV